MSVAMVFRLRVGALWQPVLEGRPSLVSAHQPPFAGPKGGQLTVGELCSCE